MSVYYSKDIGERICALIAEGKSVATICKAEDMPTESTVYQWLIREPEFLAIYDIAKEKQMEVYLNEIIDISDNVPADADAVAKAKLRVHTRQWAMGKLKPKKYGDSTTIKGDKDNPLTVNVAAALDHAIALKAAGKTIEHVPSEHMPILSEPTAYENPIEKIED